MKWRIAIAAIIIALGLAMLLPRKSVQAEVTIQAEPDQIWATIVDAKSYPEWNPIFRNVRGVFAEGSTTYIDMLVSDGSTAPVEAEVVAVLPNRKLNQRAGMTGVLTADHSWLLEPTADGTLVTQYEVYRGIGVLFWDPGYVKDLYEEGLAALKQRIEGDQLK